MEPAWAVFPDLDLVIRPPYLRMGALAVDALPPGAEWLFEPKWDGFQRLAFRDGGRVVLQFKSAQPLMPPGFTGGGPGGPSRSSAG